MSLLAKMSQIVSFRTHDGRHYLCAELDGRVVADRTAVGEWELWHVETVDGGVAFVSAHGLYLCSELDGTVVANRESAGPWETWRVVPGEDGGIGLLSHHGGFLVAEGGGGGSVLANRYYDAPGPWETFTPSAPLGHVPAGPLTRLRVEDNARWFRNDAGRFDYREVSAFSLLSRLLTGEDAYVREYLAAMRGYGFTVARVILTLDGGYWHDQCPAGRSFRCAPDMPGYWQRLDQLVAMMAEAGVYIRAVFLGAVEPFGGTWYPDRRDVWQGDVRRRGEAFVVEASQRIGRHGHVIGELANEPGQIGMRDSFDSLIGLGRKVKAVAPDMLLGGGAPDGPNDNDIRLIVRPFDYCDSHIERRMDVGGFEWVKRSGEYYPIDQPRVFDDHHPRRGQPTGIEPMPFLSGEAVNFGERRVDGNNGDVERSPSVAFAYGAVSRARQYNTNFHYDGGLWTTLPKPETVDCIRAYMAALDAFPMLTGVKWRGHWEESYFRQVWPGKDDEDVVERHIREGRGPWRVFGCGAYSVGFPEPDRWDWQANLTASADRVAYVAAGTFPCGIYRRI